MASKEFKASTLRTEKAVAAASKYMPNSVWKTNKISNNLYNHKFLYGTYFFPQGYCYNHFENRREDIADSFKLSKII